MSLSDSRLPGSRDYLNSGDSPYDKDYHFGGVKKTGQSWVQIINSLFDAGYDVSAIWNWLEGREAFTEEEIAMIDQFLLSESSKQNERNYDKRVFEETRDEQRLYDMPTNVLQRLMATGMSRNAAFKLLSGSGSGSNSAASLVGSGGVTDASVPNTPGSLDLSRAQVGLQGAVMLSDAMCNMVNTGMNANIAYQQASLLNAQASMSQDQLKAYRLTGQAYNLIQEGVNRGIIDGQNGHVYDSVQSAQVALEELAKAGNITAQEWHANGTIKQLGALAPYSSEFLSNLYKSERSGRDYDVQMSDLHRREENLNKVTAIQIMDIAQGIKESEARINEIAAQEDFINESIELVKQQANYYKKMGYKVDADAMVARAQALLYNQQARMNQWMDTEVEVPTSVGTGKVTGLSLFTQRTLDQHKAAAWAANKLNEEGAWSKEVDLHLMDVDNLIGTNLLRHWYNEQEYNVITNMSPSQQSLLGLCSAYDSGHVFQYMDRLLQSSTSKNMMGTTVDWGTRAFIETPAAGLPVIPLTTPYIKRK